MKQKSFIKQVHVTCMKCPAFIFCFCFPAFLNKIYSQHVLQIHYTHQTFEPHTYQKYQWTLEISILWKALNLSYMFFLQFSIFQCKHMHLLFSFSFQDHLNSVHVVILIFLKKKLFSHLFQETCLWFDLSASHSQFFTDSTLSVVIVTVSYLCVVEFVKASASAALHAALCALRVPLLWYRRSMFLAHLLKKCLEIMSLFSEVMIYAW